MLFFGNLHIFGLQGMQNISDFPTNRILRMILYSKTEVSSQIVHEEKAKISVPVLQCFRPMSFREVS